METNNVDNVGNVVQDLTVLRCHCGQDMIPSIINTTGFDGITRWIIVWRCPRNEARDAG